MEKMYKHLSQELKQLECINYVYPLNPTNVMLNVEKEFFFLKVEPIIIEYLLGYQSIPIAEK